MCAEPKKRDWKIRVNDIIECIAKIETYTSGMTLDQFQNDALRVDAVIRNLEVIGEAAGRIPPDVQEKYPEIAWLEMRGMRNIMIHDYFGVSIPIIWHTIQNDLASLKLGMKQMMQDQE